MLSWWRRRQVLRNLGSSRQELQARGREWFLKLSRHNAEAVLQSIDSPGPVAVLVSAATDLLPELHDPLMTAALRLYEKQRDEWAQYYDTHRTSHPNRTPHWYQLVRNLGDHGLELAVRAVENQRGPQRLLAMQLMWEWLGKPIAADRLMGCLTDPMAEVRSKAAEALGQARVDQAADALIPLLRDPDAHVRRIAAEALGQIGNRLALAPLIESLRDSDEHATHEKVRALGKFRDVNALQPLLAVVQTSSGATQHCAAEAIGKLDCEEAVVELEHLLAVRGYASESAIYGLGKSPRRRAAELLMRAFPHARRKKSDEDWPQAEGILCGLFDLALAHGDVRVIAFLHYFLCEAHFLQPRYEPWRTCGSAADRQAIVDAMSEEANSLRGSKPFEAFVSLAFTKRAHVWPILSGRWNSSFLSPALREVRQTDLQLLRQRAGNFTRAIDFMNQCDPFSMQNLLEAYRIAGLDPTDTAMFQLGGQIAPESMRRVLQESWRKFRQISESELEDKTRQFEEKPDPIGTLDEAAISKDAARGLALAWWVVPRGPGASSIRSAVCDFCVEPIPIGEGFLCNPGVIRHNIPNLSGVTDTPDLVCERCFEAGGREPWGPGLADFDEETSLVVDECVPQSPINSAWAIAPMPEEELLHHAQRGRRINAGVIATWNGDRQFETDVVSFSVIVSCPACEVPWRVKTKKFYLNWGGHHTGQESCPACNMATLAISADCSSALGGPTIRLFTWLYAGVPGTRFVPPRLRIECIHPEKAIGPPGSTTVSPSELEQPASPEESTPSISAPDHEADVASDFRAHQFRWPERTRALAPDGTTLTIEPLEYLFELERPDSSEYILQKLRHYTVTLADGSKLRLDEQALEELLGLRTLAELREATEAFQRGCVHEGRHELEQALAAFTEALRLNPEYADAFEERGSVWSYMGNADMALADWSNAKKLREGVRVTSTIDDGTASAGAEPAQARVCAVCANSDLLPGTPGSHLNTLQYCPRCRHWVCRNCLIQVGSFATTGSVSHVCPKCSQVPNP